MKKRGATFQTSPNNKSNRLIFDGIPSQFQTSLPYLPSVKASRYVEQASNTSRFSLYDILLRLGIIRAQITLVLTQA